MGHKMMQGPYFMIGITFSFKLPWGEVCVINKVLIHHSTNLGKVPLHFVWGTLVEADKRLWLRSLPKKPIYWGSRADTDLTLKFSSLLITAWSLSMILKLVGCDNFDNGYIDWLSDLLAIHLSITNIICWEKRIHILVIKGVATGVWSMNLI